MLRRYHLTPDQICANLGKIAQGCDENARPSDVIRANEIYAKIEGMLIDKVETTEKTELGSLKDEVLDTAIYGDIKPVEIEQAS
jgi:DNA recombination-dependent growth factor C